VNTGADVERVARLEALRDLIHRWDDALGPVADDELHTVRRLFDDLDGPVSPSTG